MKFIDKTLIENRHIPPCAAEVIKMGCLECDGNNLTWNTKSTPPNKTIIGFEISLAWAGGQLDNQLKELKETKSAWENVWAKYLIDEKDGKRRIKVIFRSGDNLDCYTPLIFDGSDKRRWEQAKLGLDARHIIVESIKKFTENI